MKKLEFSKILEIATGVAAVLIALGNFLSALIRPIQGFTKDYYDTTDKIFKLLMGLERFFLFVPVIVLGVALILRWVSQNKLKWVVLGSSALHHAISQEEVLSDKIVHNGVRGC